MAMTLRRAAGIDRLGALLSVAGAAALIFLPFVVFKANRIVPGDPRSLTEVLPVWQAFGSLTVLIIAALVAIGVSDARQRLLAALAGVAVLALAAAAAANVLTPVGNAVVRVAPGAAVW